VKILCVVEGHGDRLALPGLIRRVAGRLAPALQVEVPPPIRVPRSRLLKQGEMERALEFAARQCDARDGILILIDAESDCPAELGPQLLRRAAEARPDRRIRVCLACREFEAWFLAAAESLAGKRGLNSNLAGPPDPEGVSDCKGWLTYHSAPGRPYKETLDQPALAELFDLDAAALRAPSFRKFLRHVSDLLGIR
jgi:hypothetical protein